MGTRAAGPKCLFVLCNLRLHGSLIGCRFSPFGRISPPMGERRAKNVGKGPTFRLVGLSWFPTPLCISYTDRQNADGSFCGTPAVDNLRTGWVARHPLCDNTLCSVTLDLGLINPSGTLLTVSDSKQRSTLFSFSAPITMRLGQTVPHTKT